MSVSGTLVSLLVLLMTTVAHAEQPAQSIYEQPLQALDIPKFFQVAPGIFRGAQPKDEVDYDFLKDHGVRTIINLRKTKSAIKTEAARADARGMKFYSIPYGAFFAPSDKKVNATLALVTDPANQPVFLHCAAGKDRTGLIMGLYRVFYEGWNPHRAYKEMRSFGFNPWLLGLEYYFWHRAKKGAAPSDELLDENDLQLAFDREDEGETASELERFEPAVANAQ